MGVVISAEIPERHVSLAEEVERSLEDWGTTRCSKMHKMHFYSRPNKKINSMQYNKDNEKPYSIGHWPCSFHHGRFSG
jgi:hypothetical protein